MLRATHTAASRAPPDCTEGRSPRPLFAWQRTVLPHKDHVVVDIVGERATDASVGPIGREAVTRAPVTHIARAGHARIHAARELRSQDVSAEAAVAVTCVALDTSKADGLGTDEALGVPSAVAAVKVCLYEQAVEVVGKAVAHEVIASRQRPQPCLVVRRVRLAVISAGRRAASLGARSWPSARGQGQTATLWSSRLSNSLPSSM